MAAIQQTLEVERIKQYPGPQQAQRAVVVQVPGKHFPNLSAPEQRVVYEGTAMEYAERHKFAQHQQAWGAAHTGPGLRFVCDSDAVDDPDHKGFWTTLHLWNRWRHATYVNNRQAEMQFLDEMPGADLSAAAAARKEEKTPPEIKLHFELVSTGVHTFGGSGKLAGKTAVSYLYGCRKPGCKRGLAAPIKQVGSATGQLFIHMETCQPELCRKLRADSNYSPVHLDEEGEEYKLYSFSELLPHHERYVQKCFRGFDHFYETRADTGLREFIQGYNKHASLPHVQTCHQLLEVPSSKSGVEWNGVGWALTTTTTTTTPIHHSPLTTHYSRLTTHHSPPPGVRAADRQANCDHNRPPQSQVWDTVCGVNF